MAWRSNGSKVETVPQVTPLCRRLATLRGTQGSEKETGDAGGVPLGRCSRRGLQEERGGLLRPGRRRRESERSGGAGGRLDLRREMLREEEEREEVLGLLLSKLREGEEVRRSELTERAEEARGSQLEEAAPLHSLPTLRTLTLGDTV